MSDVNRYRCACSPGMGGVVSDPNGNYVKADSYDALASKLDNALAHIQTMKMDAYAAINPANSRPKDTPESLLEHYGNTLNSIAGRDSGEDILGKIFDQQNKEIERLQSQLDRLQATLKEQQRGTGVVVREKEALELRLDAGIVAWNAYCLAQIEGNTEDRLEAQRNLMAALLGKDVTSSSLVDIVENAKKRISEWSDFLKPTAVDRQEPGPEEGGEDVFGVPQNCVRWPCKGEVKLDPLSGLWTCHDCGASYGEEMSGPSTPYQGMDSGSRDGGAKMHPGGPDSTAPDRRGITPNDVKPVERSVISDHLNGYYGSGFKRFDILETLELKRGESMDDAILRGMREGTVKPVFESTAPDNQFQYTSVGWCSEHGNWARTDGDGCPSCASEKLRHPAAKVSGPEKP